MKGRVQRLLGAVVERRAHTPNVASSNVSLPPTMPLSINYARTYLVGVNRTTGIATGTDELAPGDSPPVKFLGYNVFSIG